MLRLYRFLLISAIGVVTYSCQPTASDTPLRMEDQFNTVVVETETIVTGQMVYVPVYSHVYQRNVNNPVMQLSATLSFRNTDLENSLILTAVRYYDSQGELVRNALERPIELPALASVDYLVEAEDTSGGIGANFIVEWVAATTVTEPVIEALMIATTGNQGISFISPGRVIQQQGTPVAAPSDSP
ncbi:DUF3124 domain-containing protein [Egbenema bharatensis]|uniref:DUF3124 domain-containing protein n=1 Tax=Egbenema bharatensis TaxID=3463334 RepID=UPI003A8B0938